MRIIFFICVAATALLSAFAAVKLDDDKAVQGIWIPVKAELGGQPWPDDMLKAITLKVESGKYEVTVKGAPEPDRGTCILDANATPKAMSITSTNGPNRGKTFPAIYELQGDTLRVCYDLSGAKRPAAFTTAAGSQLYLVTYHRKTD